MRGAVLVAVAGGPPRPVDPAAPVYAADDRGAALGDGVFETVEVWRGDAPLWPEHEARLRAAAAALALPVPWSGADLRAAVRQAAAVAGLARGVARVAVSRGRGPRGYAPPRRARPRLVVQVGPRPAPPRPWRLALLPTPRADPAAVTWTHKTLGATERVHAALRARAAGAHAGLLLGPRGAIASATSANLFWVRGATLWTPHPACGLRAGVARALVLRLAPALGLRVRVGRYPLAALLEADEVFVTNAVLRVHPVVALLGHRTWAPGPWTRALRAAYARVVARAAGS